MLRILCTSIFPFHSNYMLCAHFYRNRFRIFILDQNLKIYQSAPGFRFKTQAFSTTQVVSKLYVFILIMIFASYLAYAFSSQIKLYTDLWYKTHQTNERKAAWVEGGLGHLETHLPPSSAGGYQGLPTDQPSLPGAKDRLTRNRIARNLKLTHRTQATTGLGFSSSPRDITGAQC